MIGVYKITNTVDGKVYIGSSAVDIDCRWSTHRALLRTGKHYNRHLQRAWNKYGESVFTFEVVEPGTDKKDVREKELSWIARFFGKNCYNATTEAAGRLAKPKEPKVKGFRKHAVPHVRGELSVAECFKVAEWLREKGIVFEGSAKRLWRKNPDEVAVTYGVTGADVARAAGREDMK